jgi:hypothetical protein
MNFETRELNDAELEGVAGGASCAAAQEAARRDLTLSLFYGACGDPGRAAASLGKAIGEIEYCGP